MQRIVWFLRALPPGAKPQQALVVLILGYNFVVVDLNPGNRFLGSPLWMTTVPIIVSMIALSRLLLSAMMPRPARTQQVLQGLGLLVFGVWLVWTLQWGGMPFFLYLGDMVAGFWFVTAANFWFVSETQRRQELAMSELTELLAKGTVVFSDETDIDRDDHATDDAHREVR